MNHLEFLLASVNHMYRRRDDMVKAEQVCFQESASLQQKLQDQAEVCWLEYVVIKHLVLTLNLLRFHWLDAGWA